MMALLVKFLQHSYEYISRILLVSGALIRVKDCKHTPFLVLGLSLWYGTICVFLEQIAPLPAAHMLTRCKDFYRYRVREMVAKMLIIYFCPQLNAFMSIGILFK